jgi:hypothetical protein
MLEIFVETDHKLIYKFCKNFCFQAVNVNMEIGRIFVVKCDEYDTLGICTNGNYAEKLMTGLCYY